MPGVVSFAGPVTLLAAMLFLCGELYKKVGLGRHLVPAALGVTGVVMAMGFCLAEGMAMAEAAVEALVTGVLGAAVCVYIYQLAMQATRADRFQAPFKGFYFDKKGEGQ